MPRPADSSGSASWRYTALASDGQLRQGRAEGPDEAHIVAFLRRSGLVPVRIVPEAGGWRVAADRGLSMRFEWRRKGLRRRDVMEMTRGLALMLAAGLDLDRSMRFLIATASRARVRAVLEGLRERMRGGGAFAAALVMYPESFPPLYTGLVQAGEAGGALADTLARLAELLERERKLTASVQSALIYPIILLVASTGSIILLLTMVLPQFVPLFEEAGAQLPLATRIVIATGDFLSAWGLVLLLALLLGGVLANMLLRRPDIRLLADRAILRLPVFGGLARDIMAARLMRTLGTLLQNGLPLLGALRIATGVIGNRAGAKAVEAAAMTARGGGGLARPLAESGVFPIGATQLLQLGEETAQLGPLCLRAAEIHEESARIGIQRLISLLVPAITIVMGAIVAGIVFALLLAMLGLNDLAH